MKNYDNFSIEANKEIWKMFTTSGENLREILKKKLLQFSGTIDEVLQKFRKNFWGVKGKVFKNFFLNLNEVLEILIIRRNFEEFGRKIKK